MIDQRRESTHRHHVADSSTWSARFWPIGAGRGRNPIADVSRFRCPLCGAAAPPARPAQFGQLLPVIEPNGHP